jgi:hypothetical protein
MNKEEINKLEKFKITTEQVKQLIEGITGVKVQNKVLFKTKLGEEQVIVKRIFYNSKEEIQNILKQVKNM